MNKVTILTPKNNPLPKDGIFSPYDTIEGLNFQAQKINSLLDNIQNLKSFSPKLIEEAKQQIYKLVHTCEEALESKRSPRNISILSISDNLNPLSTSSGKNMLQAEAQYEFRISTLEEQLKKSDESKQRVHSFYQDCLRQLDHDIDKLIHDF